VPIGVPPPKMYKDLGPHCPLFAKSMSPISIIISNPISLILDFGGSTPIGTIQHGKNAHEKMSF
jgi:hypothetical protein